jgi:hypothetical protein
MMVSPVTEAGADGRATMAGTSLGDCGCDLLDGRCARHASMMRTLHAVFYCGSPNLVRDVWANSDGYGERGLIPEQGLDWSGIRDSSIEAIEAMFAAATGG